MTMRTELTLDEAMTDPMILLVMQADRVDPTKLRRAWTPLIDKLRAESKSDQSATDEDALQETPVMWRDLVGDCVCSAWAAAAKHPSAKHKVKAGMR